MNNGIYYEVEKIINIKEINGKKKYLIKWKNYDFTHNSWVKEKDIKELEKLLKNYEKELANKEKDLTSLKNIEENGLLDNSTFVKNIKTEINTNKDFGSFKLGDKIESILKCSSVKKDNLIYFLINWKERVNNYKPKNSILSNKDLTKYDPISLIEYYESKINIIN